MSSNATMELLKIAQFKFLWMNTSKNTPAKIVCFYSDISKGTANEHVEKDKGIFFVLSVQSEKRTTEYISLPQQE